MFETPEDSTRDACFHAMNPKATKVFRKLYADVWNIGNNHIMDAGIDGIISTKEIAVRENCRTVGAGLNRTDASEPVYLEEAGGIGILSVTYMAGCIPATETDPGIFRWDEMDYIEKRIKEIKSRCRWCIMMSHGGEEFTTLPLPYTRNRYLKFLEMGADVVVGHHPHVPENYELFDNGKAIFYSLGNFIFDTDYQRAHKYTDVGVLLKLVFSEEKFDFEAIGTKICRGEERIDIADLPGIFENIPAEEYELTSPLGAKAFVAEEKRRVIFLHPEIYEHFSLEDWHNYFFSTDPEDYRKGRHMDFFVVVPHSHKAESEQWKQSKLENVKEYLISLL